MNVKDVCRNRGYYKCYISIINLQSMFYRNVLNMIDDSNYLKPLNKTSLRNHWGKQNDSIYKYDLAEYCWKLITTIWKVMDI